MNYSALPEHLHSTADVVYGYLTRTLGLLSVQIEKPIDQKADYRTTFCAKARDHHYYCVDVSENIYTPTRWLFVTQCEHNGMPVKFYVAMPSTSYSGFSSDLKKAKGAGVGVLEVTASAQDLVDISPAVSLSLCGLRRFDKPEFPRKYREIVANAESTFRNGEPAKACSAIYDEIESLTRRIASQAHKKGRFRNPPGNPKSLERMPWARVLTHLRDDVDRIAPSPYSILTDALIAQILGTTPHRNQSGHKPGTLKALVERDSRLRTRMEAAVDLLHEVTTATASLRL